MTKLVSLYFRDGVLYVLPASHTVDGLWINDQPFEKMSMSAPACENGAAVRRALELSREGVRHPAREEFSLLTLPLREAAGAPTWHAFAKTAKHVDVMAKDGVWLLTPYSYMGKGGFEPLSDSAVAVEADSADDVVGEALLAVLARCD